MSLTPPPSIELVLPTHEEVGSRAPVLPVTSGLVVDTQLEKLEQQIPPYPVVVALDGARYSVPWGTHFFPALPGKHQVSVWCAWALEQRVGQASLSGELEPGEVVYLIWRMPPALLSTPGVLRAV